MSTRKFRPAESRSALYAAAVRTLAELVDAEGAGAAKDACGEAIAERLREDYQQVGGFRPSEGRICIQRLLGRQCRRYTVPWRLGECACDPPGADHQTLWNKDGQPAAYLSQPYPLGLKTLRETVAFCDRWELEVIVSTWPSWHYPGNVLSLEFTRLGEHG